MSSYLNKQPILISTLREHKLTEKITYLMGALQRNETEKYCLDNKLTFFGCSLDGESAFEVVDRSIQLRELYCAGLRGQYWESAWMSYNNSLTKVKMSGKLSRTLKETLGVKQRNTSGRGRLWGPAPNMI